MSVSTPIQAPIPARDLVAEPLPARTPIPAVPAVGDATAPAGLRAAQAIVDAHGDDSLAPFIVRPDKCLHFVAGGVVAYRRIGRTLVVSGDPVGSPASRLRALRGLREFAAAEGLRTVVYGASAAQLDVYHQAGMRSICVGEEAIVDPSTFSLEGRAVRKLRQSVQRVRSRGWTIAAVDGRDVDAILESEIEAVEGRWRSSRERVLGFSMSFGEHEYGVRPGDLFLLARSPEGELRAVMRFLSHRGNLSLDTMRRVGETPNGLNEALVCSALTVAHERGVAEVSLNYAGLAHLIRHEPEGNRLTRAVRRRALRRLSHRFQMERLVRFNDKFGPEWRPRYLVYESRRSLPGAIYRVLQSEGYLSEPAPRPLGRGGTG
jgi:lysyl-tRNA synthetase, class II